MLAIPLVADTELFVLALIMLVLCLASAFAGWLIHDVKVGQRGLRNYSASYGRRFRKSFRHQFGPGPQAPPRPELVPPPRSHVKLVPDQPDSQADRTGDTSGDYPRPPRAVGANPALGKCLCHGLVARSAYAGWVHVDPERDDHQAVYVGALGTKMPEGPEEPSS